MKLSHQTAGNAAEWINQHFHRDDHFPAICTSYETSNYGITLEHLKAYKDWSKTPATADGINDWISAWLNDDEQSELERAIMMRQRQRL